MEYLIEHNGEHEQSSTSGNAEETRADANASAPATERLRETALVGNPSTTSSSSTLATRVTAGGNTKLSWNILDLYRKYRYQQFRVNSKAKENLLSMGFDESDVLDALRACNNDPGAALEILLDENRLAALRTAGTNANVSSSVSDEGSSFAAFGGGPPVTALDPSSSLHRAIVANPTIQLGLTNPRSLIALLQILENPTQTMLWLNDPDTAPMLIAVSRIYHAEKHATKSASAPLT